MSHAITNRVRLPDGERIYVSDDVYGDQRLRELHAKYGNLAMEACTKEWGKTLDELETVWTGTIEEFFS